jgi:type I restriction enzyme, S subunit
MTDGPYKLPSGWRWVRLEKTTSLLRSGFAFGKKGAAKGHLLHLRPYNIGVDGTLNLSQQFLIPSASKSNEEVLLQPGDVLFNNTNSVELVGKTALVREPINAEYSNHITLMRTYANVCQGAWLALSLRTFWQQGFFAQRCNKWIGQAGYNTQMLQETPVPLPPLAEQRRIVARVEALMERIREAKSLRVTSNQDVSTLIEAALAEVFPSKESQKGWPSIGELCEIRGGMQKSPKRTPKNNPRPYLRVANVQQGYLALQDIAYFEVSDSELERYRLLPNDVLIIEGNGSPDLIGRTAIFRGEIDNCVHQNHVIRLRPNTSHILSEFLSAYLTSPTGRRIIGELSHTSSGLLNLSVGKIRSIPVPPFSLSEQERVVSHLNSVHNQVAALKRAQEDTNAELRRLEQAILDQAVRGEL